MSAAARLLAAAVGASLLLSSAAAARQAPAPAASAPAPASGFLAIPFGDLGDPVNDAEFHFDFRLPAGMEPIPPAELQEMRDRLPDLAATFGPEAKDAKLQLWMYRGGDGSNVLIRGHVPPMNRIDTPAALRNILNDEDRRAGHTLRNRGEPVQFRTRDSRIGFVFEREIGLGAERTNAQVIAFLRAPDRSLIIQYTTTLENYEKRRDDFLASLGTFALPEGRRVLATEAVTGRSTADVGRGPLVANLAIALAGIVLIVHLVRKGANRDAPAAAAR